jgi:hypothetical protein
MSKTFYTAESEISVRLCFAIQGQWTPAWTINGVRQVDSDYERPCIKNGKEQVVARLWVLCQVKLKGIRNTTFNFRIHSVSVEIRTGSLSGLAQNSPAATYWNRGQSTDNVTSATSPSILIRVNQINRILREQPKVTFNRSRNSLFLRYQKTITALRKAYIGLHTASTVCI